MAKVIFHIDLNAFYVSAEVLRNSALEGQPVAVGGLSQRSVISTASYEARDYGVHSAMPIHEALKKCPDLVVLECDMHYYSEISKKFFEFVKTYTSYVEIASIDECYADMTETIKQYKRPLDLAWELQQELFNKLKLKCSIGIAPTKFLAKMASDRYKPMGIYIIRRSELDTKLWPLPIEETYGIGKKSAPLLKKIGIVTIGDLNDTKHEHSIQKILGKQYTQIVDCINGKSSDKIEFSHSLQSLSQATTFKNDILDYSDVSTQLKHLSKNLSIRAKSNNVTGKLITITIRYSDFKTIVRSRNIDYYTDDENKIYETVMLLFDENADHLPIRLLGVALGSLYSKSKVVTQLDLFTKHEQKYDVIDKLNKEIPGANFIYASQITGKRGKNGNR